MTPSGRIARLAALTCIALLVALGCDDSSTAPSTQGNLSVRLTDAPVEGVAEINVFITGLTIKPMTGPVERIADEVGSVDLLALQGTSELLATAGVEPGEYEFIQVELDQDRSNVVLEESLETLPLQISSEEVKVLGGFTVEPVGDTVITLDFDAAASLRLQGNRTYRLVPVIAMVPPAAG